MYVIPPHSSTPRWMPESARSNATKNADGLQGDMTTFSSSGRASKQRMDDYKRKRFIGDDDGAYDGLDRYGNAQIDASIDEAKRARTASIVRFDPVRSVQLILPHSDDVQMELCSTSAAAPGNLQIEIGASHASPRPTNANLCHTASASPYAASPIVVPSYFPEQCLRLSISTPTGHPHPYASDTIHSAPAVSDSHRARNELGAGYFDAVRF